MRIVSFAAALALLVTACGTDWDFAGIVTAITDGDTLKVQTLGGEDVIVRLADIDAPERDQPYGGQSRRALSGLTLQRSVTVRYMDTDSYGRTVGRIYSGDIDVSAEMIRRGLAWAYRDYLRDDSLVAVEAEARSAGRGLWADGQEPIPPWAWRRGQRPAAPPAAPSRTLPQAFSCGAKRYCREMTSCEEAVFYLEQCGATTIDGDHDGIPCEAICPAR